MGESPEVPWDGKLPADEVGAVSASAATGEETPFVATVTKGVFCMNVKKTTVRLTVMAMLIGLEIVLSRFLSIPTSITKIGFAFIPVAAAALLLGPLAAGAVGALGDLLGALLFPIGAYFPGFTLTAFLMGLCYGLFLYKDAAFWRVIAAVGVHQFVLSMLLNSLWLWIISTSADKGYWAVVLARVPQTLLLAAVQLAVIPALVRILPRLRKALP